MTRPSNPADPTAERTADQSTQSAGGLSGGRPEHAPERAHDAAADEEDVVPRTRDEWPQTPHRSDETRRQGADPQNE